MCRKGDRKARRDRWGFGRTLSGLSLLALVAVIGHGQTLSPFAVDVRSRAQYEISRLEPFFFVYSDREFVFTQVPACLENRPYVLTANSDKLSDDSTFMTIASQVPVSVYVGYDQRYKAIPRWLTSFERTPSLELVMSDPAGTSPVVFDVYRRTYPAGKIQLGGNRSANRSNWAMYTVVLVERLRDVCQSR